MVIQEEVRCVLHQLSSGRLINLTVDGCDIWMRFFEEESTLALSTLVYDGGNYIPPSVRECLSRIAPFSKGHIPARLSVEEETYQIRLNYSGRMTRLTHDHLAEIIEEFEYLAEKWRYYLDEHGKRDLIHVRVK